MDDRRNETHLVTVRDDSAFGKWLTKKTREKYTKPMTELSVLDFLELANDPDFTEAVSALIQNIREPNMNDRPSIDERLAAIAESLELLVHQSQEIRRRQDELDKREHQSRMALLTGIRGYLEALGENGKE